MLGTMKKERKTKKQIKEEKRLQQDLIKKEKQASRLLGEIEFVGCQSLILRQQKEEYFYLVRKDGTFEICAIVGGMTLENIRDEEFNRVYTKPLKVLFTAIPGSYFKIIDVPISFVRKIDAAKDRLAQSTHEKDVLREELFRDDVDFFELLQESQILQTLPILFIPCAHKDEVARRMNQVLSLSAFNIQLLDREQSEVVVRYMNNPGTSIPAFDVI